MSRTDEVAPAITVLMPVYNGSRFLNEQVQSILDQDYPSVRITILDDCSTDGSAVIADKIQATDSRVTVLHAKLNRGLMLSIGVLLTSVDTPYFALSDQDDIWDRDKLTRSIDKLRTSGAELVYSDVRVVNTYGEIIDASYLTSRRITPLRGRNPVPFVFRNPAIGHTFVATKEVAEKSKDVPGDLVHHEAWILAAASSFGQIDFVPATLGSYRQHDANVVGPKGASRAAVGLGYLRHVKRIELRQRKRAISLEKAGAFSSAAATGALFWKHSPAKRLIKVPSFAAYLRANASEIGFVARWTEVAMFAIEAMTSIGRGQRSSP